MAQHASAHGRVGMAALLGSLAAPMPPAHAGELSHSIHILARIPALCSLRDVSRVIALTGVTDEGVFVDAATGTGGFRVECNVPYAMKLRHVGGRVQTRGYVVPTSADLGDLDAPSTDSGAPGIARKRLPLSALPARDLDVHLTAPGVEALDGQRCGADVLQNDPSGCDVAMTRTTTALARVSARVGSPRRSGARTRLTVTAITHPTELEPGTSAESVSESVLSLDLSARL